MLFVELIISVLHRYHTVCGPTLKDIPDESWEIVQKEKAADMIHVLDFPYNGEPPRDKLMQGKITPNEVFRKI